MNQQFLSMEYGRADPMNQSMHIPRHNQDVFDEYRQHFRHQGGYDDQQIHQMQQQMRPRNSMAPTQGQAHGPIMTQPHGVGTKNMRVPVVNSMKQRVNPSSKGQLSGRTSNMSTNKKWGSPGKWEVWPNSESDKKASKETIHDLAWFNQSNQLIASSNLNLRNSSNLCNRCVCKYGIWNGR